jgi:hypothetical protein
MPLTETIAAITAAFEAGLILQSGTGALKETLTNALSENSSSILQKIEGLADRREVCHGGNMDPSLFLSPHETVESPIVEALEDLYINARPHGRTYVLYAPPTQGKTCGARYFLQTQLFNFTSEDNVSLPPPKGIMITGTGIQNYFQHMESILGAQDCGAWMVSLIAAMMPDANLPMDHLTPVLLLDHFNHDSEENRVFLEKLFCSAHNCKFYIVIITQNREFANYMCKMNGGKKIAPLPAAISNRDDKEAWKDPTWNGLKWSRALLSEMIDLKFPNQFIPEDSHGHAWLSSNDSPQEAIWKATEKLTKPCSPKKKKRKYDDE